MPSVHKYKAYENTLRHNFLQVFINQLHICHVELYVFMSQVIASGKLNTHRQYLPKAMDYLDFRRRELPTSEPSRGHLLVNIPSFSRYFQEVEAERAEKAVTNGGIFVLLWIASIWSCSS